jgi:hypothetical protein
MLDYATAVDADAIIAAVQSEFQCHTWDFFVTEPPSVAQGGKGVVVPGCPACRKRLNTLGQFVDHLSRDVLPRVLRRVCS